MAKNSDPLEPRLEVGARQKVGHPDTISWKLQYNDHASAERAWATANRLEA